MSTLRRALDPFAKALLLTFWLLAPAAASEPAALPVRAVVEGLAQPTGIAARVGPRGGVELAIAEAGAGCVTSVVLLGGERHGSTTLVEGLGAEPLAVAWTGDGVLLVAGETLSVYGRQRAGLPATLLSTAGADAPERTRLGSLVATDRHVYALGDGTLRRSRRLADQLTEMREVGVGGEGHRLVGLSLNHLGYLTALVNGPLTHELWFLDPERPDGAGTVIAVTGLQSPSALAYGAVPRPSEPLLYALQADGVYRIDATGPSLSTARRVAEVASPKGMAFGPDGALYVVTADEDRTGVVLRFAGEY